MKKIIFRNLAEMPCDKVFDVNGNEEFCHATGREICDGDPMDPANWRIEYMDSEGEHHYGR